MYAFVYTFVLSSLLYTVSVFATHCAPLNVNCNVASVVASNGEIANVDIVGNDFTSYPKIITLYLLPLVGLIQKDMLTVFSSTAVDVTILSYKTPPSSTQKPPKIEG